MSITQADIPDKKEQVWITETLQIFHEPELEKFDLFGDAENYSIHAIPVLPAQDADREAWRSYFSQSDRICRNYIGRFEWYFPKGTLFTFDHITQTLAIHTHAEAKPIIEKWRMMEKVRFPHHVNLSAEILEADPSVMLPIITEGLHLNDYDGIWNQMQALVKEGEIRTVKKVNLISGEHAESYITQDINNRMMKSLTIDQENGPAFVYADQSSFKLHVAQAHPWPNGKSTSRIKLTATLFQGYDAPASRLQNTGTLDVRLPEQVEWYDWNRAQLKYHGYISKGNATLVGSWTTSQDALTKPRQYAVFFKADVSYLLPEPNEKLKTLLKQHNSLAPDKPSGPTKKPDLPEPPSGMMVKELQVPACFFYSTKEDKAKNARETTLSHLLNQSGLSLPQNSKVTFKATTGTAIVTTTPEAMAKIEEHFADCDRQSLTDGLIYHLQILEASPSDLSELLKDSATPCWESLQPLIKQGQIAVHDIIVLQGSGNNETIADFGTWVQNLARDDHSKSPHVKLVNSNIGTSISLRPERSLQNDRLPVRVSLKQQARENIDSLPVDICDLSHLESELLLGVPCWIGSWTFNQVHPKTRLAFLTINRATSH